MDNDRIELLNAIQMYDFALNDINLYLDTHPDCTHGLEYFHKYHELKQDAMKEYTEKYGPLKASQVRSKTRWTWINEPWPWERSDS